VAGAAEMEASVGPTEVDEGGGLDEAAAETSVDVSAGGAEGDVAPGVFAASLGLMSSVRARFAGCC